MTGGTRTPTWKERENNKRRERRRRAFAAKIFCGLRLYGNYTLPKHCDNNEVLKALCNEAGWTVHPDGTTYRKGCKPVDNMDFMGRSTSASPCTSYNPSPPSSSIPSPISRADGNSLIPWLRNLSSSSSSSSKHMHHYMHIGGSMSAPVTPPLSSPTAQTPQIFDNSFDFLPLSTPPSPSRVRIPQSGPTSPTFSLVSLNPFGFGLTRSGSLMGQSGTCSPCVDIPMGEMIPSNEFAFGSNNINNNNGLVKAWEGERIHEEYCGSDELELTLGTSKTR